METGWNHFELRGFDPVIGRWTATDPAGQYWSSYVGMGNNPISGVDANGAYSQFGAWWRNGFSSDGVMFDEETGEYGFNTFEDGGVVSHYGDERSKLHQLDPFTVGNWFFRYGGPSNPQNYDGTYNYDLAPKNISDKMAYIHDKDYDEKNAVGALDLFLNTSVINADMKFVKNQLKIAGGYLSQFKPLPGGGVVYTPIIDPVTTEPLTLSTGVNALIQGLGLGIVSAPKMLVHGALTYGPPKIFPTN